MASRLRSTAAARFPDSCATPWPSAASSPAPMGLVGYALDAELVHKTFWTFSVWQDRASLDAFAPSEPHRAITRRLRPLMGQTRFEFFPVSGASLPRTWDQMKAPLRSEHR
jgi:hypothetical protein